MGDWTYEAKDFLTPAPYEALYQFHGQPFVHETKLQELSVYAANQGFRGFKSMYKKYIESLKAQAGTVYVDILQDAGYSTAAMISYLKQNNLIVTRGRNNTRGKRINGIPTECFCLVLPPVDLDDEDALDELPL